MNNTGKISGPGITGRASPAAGDLTWIIHKEIWFWARRNGNGGGEVPSYLEHAIFIPTQPRSKFRSYTFITHKKDSL